MQNSQSHTFKYGGSKIYSNVVNPTLTVYLPSSTKANGAAAILCPGGAMRMPGFAETERAAEWLNSKGIAAFILRVSGFCGHHPVIQH